MLAALPVPILSVAAEAVRDLQGQDALYSLWTVFTKCKESVHDGRRLENISWRLWYRELIQTQASYQPPTPQSPSPHPKDDRSRSSYFPAPPNEKVSPKPQPLPSGLPSPSDQSSPSPLPPPVSTMIPPSTPERPRISPLTALSTLSSCARDKSTVCVGRMIVDMLPNQVSLPQRKSTPAIMTTVVVSTPPQTLQSSSCDPDVPLVQLPASADASFPRVVVVNPTPHPTPPTTPILHDDRPGAPQPPSAFLSPPLPSPALRPVPTVEPRAEQPLPSLRPSLIAKEPPLFPTPARIADGGSSTRQSDRQFFLQQSPEDASPERGDGSTASGKSPSDLFEASSAASSQVKSVLTDVDDDKKGDEEEEDDRRSTTAAAGAGARHGRQSKPKRAKEVGKRPLVKRSHSAKHVAPSMLRLSTLQQSHPQPERVANTTATTNGNANANTHQSRKTIILANTSSEDYETTDGEDSEGWASEDMNAEDKAREAEETRLREAALEAQRQRELFAKVPKRSYSTLNRTQSGLLSQLMNPNPAIFPPNHPYRVSRSSADLSRQYLPQQHHAPVPQRSSSAYAPTRLSTSKSVVALPLAAQITAVSSSRPPASSAAKRQESEKNGYRPKGPPKEQEMEDESGDDADDKIQMSQSVAQQRLQALISRRGSHQGGPSHLIQPVAMEVGPGLMGPKTAPIPLGHPYNLPAAAPPMTPRTTRRRMLKTELSESMRRQLLWERQVSSNTNPALVARRANQGLSGLRPLTSNSSEGIRDAATGAQDKDERRRRALARNRSWADDYHYSGW